MPKKKEEELTIKERINRAVKKANKAAEEWLKENENQIEYKVRKMLDEKLQEIVAKLMGFNNHWGKWEVDHCNGRAEESIVGDWIRTQAREATMKWLSEQVGSLPNLPSAAVKDARKDYLESLERMIGERMKETARENAEKEVKRVLGEDFNYGIT